MVEKLASSEIAQSRERFEKAANNLLHPKRDELEHDALGGYKWADVECMWRIWQAAERDTRERVAQEVEEKWRHPQAKWIAAQIRGKEL
jgi:hypothetical protein